MDLTPRPRAPGFTYAIACLVVVILVASLALTARNPPPPSIAEFAPQAVAQITDPSEDSAHGASGPASAHDSATPLPGEAEAASAAIEVARVRQCIGDPPRQSEDPQSPPCVPHWSGDNGGSTWKGVTRDEIVLAHPDFSSAGLDFIDAMIAHFNRRYEFYGRKLVRRGFDVWQASIDRVGDPAIQQADAVKADEELGAFASLGYPSEGDSGYQDELARRRIISVNVTATKKFEDEYELVAPYEWNYLAPLDNIETNLAEFICASLVGRPPRWAGPGFELSNTRKFGVIAEESPNGLARSDVLLQGLRACGVRPEYGTYRVAGAYDGQDGPTQEVAVNTMVMMKTAGVSSIICICNMTPMAHSLMSPATGQGYFPEWIVSPYQMQDLDFVGLYWPQEQNAHAFGIRGWNKAHPPRDMPYYWAVKESDPTLEPGKGEAARTVDGVYWELLMLASGIQLAGPDLTPLNFEAGLHKVRFPNPGAGAPPYYQAAMTPGGRHTFLHDYGLIWWDQTQESMALLGTRGSYCTIAHGARFAAGRWPRAEHSFFSGDCR